MPRGFVEWTDVTRKTMFRTIDEANEHRDYFFTEAGLLSYMDEYGEQLIFSPTAWVYFQEVRVATEPPTIDVRLG